MIRTPRALEILVLSAWPLLNPCVAHADVVLDWNTLALQTTAAAPFNPPLESRNLAIVHTRSACTPRAARRRGPLLPRRHTLRSCSSIPLSRRCWTPPMLNRFS